MGMMGTWAIVTIALHVVSRLAYVIGVGIALTRQERYQYFTHRDGIEAGFRRFRLLAAVLMNTDIVTFLILCVVTRNTMGASLPLPSMLLATALILIGCGTKLWATIRIGWKPFYWHNFFETAADDAPLPTGPYRFLQNPMYTLGYVHLYGIALVAGSTPGLIAAAFDHATILIFHHIVEKPHFKLVTTLAAERQRNA
jgi:protein-S-isoprenylcysteine O-methyltransferase Ste14